MTNLSHAFIHDLNSKILAPAMTTEFMSTHQTSQILHSNTMLNHATTSHQLHTSCTDY